MNEKVPVERLEFGTRAPDAFLILIYTEDAALIHVVNDAPLVDVIAPVAIVFDAIVKGNPPIVMSAELDVEGKVI